MARFSLRFYNQTDEKVEECISRLKENNPLIRGHEFEDPKKSMTGKKPSHQAYLLFDSKADEYSMISNDRLRDIYMAYSAPGMQGTFAQRYPGDPAFAV